MTQCYVFLCTDKTEKTCLQNKIFGLAGKYWSVVRKISKGNKLLLYNLDSGSLYGVFEATSDGTEKIAPRAWGGRYPAQVRVTIDSDELREISSAGSVFPFLRKKPVKLTKEQAEMLLKEFEKAPVIDEKIYMEHMTPKAEKLFETFLDNQEVPYIRTSQEVEDFSSNQDRIDDMTRVKRIVRKEKKVLFRNLVRLPSTTYATFGLYRYPAKFIPHVIAYVLETYAKPKMTVFDPFAGYGTVGVVSRIYGFDYELWDLNPLLETFHEIATLEHGEISIKELLRQMIISKLEYIPKWTRLHYWFPPEFLPLLFKVWGFYHSLEDEYLKSVLTIPLLNTTRYFSYDDMQRQKLSKSPKSEKRINSLLNCGWKTKFYQMLTDEMKRVLTGIQEYWKLSPKQVKAIVKSGIDTLSTELEEERSILITSPPYLQSHEYIRQAKMNLFWLGYTEEDVRKLSKLEIPYRDVESQSIHSETFHRLRDEIPENHLRKVFERYFWGVLGALTRLQKKVDSYLFLFIGRPSMRGRQVPIDHIFVEHFTALDWIHEVTLRDTIVSRRMFSYRFNPATGVKDKRTKMENLVILRKK